VVEVKMGNAEIKAVITPTSCEMLGLEPGRETYAVFKASNGQDNTVNPRTIKI